MPTPAKTSPSEIIAAARDLLAEVGIDSLTMQAVADRVGVRGPSLYKHFADRAALLSAVEQTVVADLKNVLVAAATSPDDKTALRAMAKAYRRFACESPATYALIFSLQSPDEVSLAARRLSLEPVLARLESYLGDRNLAFVRARVLTAFLHGFVSMETTGAFGMGGNIDSAFSMGLDILLARPAPGSFTPGRPRR